MSQPSAPPGGNGPRPRSTTNPGARVMSAARTAPLPKEPVSKVELSSKLKDGAADTALNAAAIVKEGIQEFIHRDRSFKYKVLIISLWAALSMAGIYVAWPEASVKTDTSLGARLVLGANPDRPVWVIWNETEDAWTEVSVTVNGAFQASASRIEPHQDFTFTPKQLIGRFGRSAPENLRASDIVLHTHAGGSTLLKDGEVK